MKGNQYRKNKITAGYWRDFLTTKQMKKYSGKCVRNMNKKLATETE